jgi:hypothetical protein
MKKLELKYRKLLRRIFGCISFTAVAFVFQACYGTKDNYSFYDVKLTGTVRSKTTNLPIQGIKIAVNGENFGMGMTNENGEFDFYASVPCRDYYHHDYYSYNVIYKHDSVNVHFSDIDGIKNGQFADTTIIINPANKDEVKIHVILENK